MAATGLDAVRYAAANARLRGLYARLLSADAWRELLTAQDLPATLAILRDTAYSDLFSSSSSGELTLEQVEHQLSGRAAGNCRRTMAFVSGGARDLIQVWWQHFELENLKAVFRGVDQQLGPDAIRRFLIPLGDYSTLPWEALLNERTISGLIEHLSNTHYINPLRNAYPAYQRDRALFALEIALDIRYYRDLAAAINHLPSAESEQARTVLGVRLDMLNILWSFRYRVYYNLSVEEIVNYTLWHTFHTDTALVRDIALGADPRDILTRVWGRYDLDLTPLDGWGPRDVDAARLMPQLELLLERLWRRLAWRQLAGYPFKLGATLSYLVLQELEIRDLVTLLEGKAMGWNLERLNQYLIRGEE